MRFYLDQFSASSLNVHTIHAETEGMSQFETFTAIVRELKERGARFLQLRKLRSACASRSFP